MWLDVIDGGCRHNQSGGTAHPASWFDTKLVRPASLPRRAVVPLLDFGSHRPFSRLIIVMAGSIDALRRPPMRYFAPGLWRQRRRHERVRQARKYRHVFDTARFDPSGRLWRGCVFVVCNGCHG
jgi:hypothetical protein